VLEVPNASYRVSVAGDEDLSGIYMESDAENSGLPVFVKT
jgi:hypothetical protein